MGSITKRGDKFQAFIRKNKENISATFSDEETAKLWIKYKEDLMEDMKNFNASPEEIITLEHCITLKANELKQNQVSRRSIEDVELMRDIFSSLTNCAIKNISADEIRNIVQVMLKSTVKKGGGKHGGGNIRITSPVTVLRKLRVLATVFQFVIEKGANIKNSAQIVINELKTSLEKKES